MIRRMQIQSRTVKYPNTREREVALIKEGVFFTLACGPVKQRLEAV